MSKYTKQSNKIGKLIHLTKDTMDKLNAMKATTGEPTTRIIERYVKQGLKNKS